MKRKLLAFIILLIFFPFPSYADPRETIRIAGDENYPPYEFVDKTGVYKGFNVDIMRAVAIELGIDVELTPMTWENALRALESGEVDVIQGMNRSEIREEKFSFTDELVINSQVIFVRKDTHNITELNDLEGLVVAIQSGDISEEFVKKIPRIKVVVSSNQELAIESLLNGSVDAYLGNRLTGLYVLQNMKRYMEVKIVGDPLNSTEYCSATLKSNTNVLALMNQGIVKIKQNGTYDKIYRKWFGETLEDKSQVFKRWLIISCIIIIITTVLAALVFYWNRSLKKMVAFKTLELADVNKELRIQQTRLEQSNRQRGKILENIQSGIVAFDQNGEVLASNFAAKDILNQSPDQNVTFLELNFTDEIVAGYESARQGTVWRKEIEWASASREVLNIDCVISPIKGPDESVEGVLMIFHDYTESKRLKDVLNNDDKMRALGNLAAGIAHELRNPLTAMKAFIDMIPYKFDNADFREQMTAILNLEMQRLNSLVSMLLDYVKPRATEPKPFLLNHSIEEVLTLFATPLCQKNIQVHFESKDTPICADEQQIKQVLVNLLINSMEAIRDKGDIIISTYQDEGQTTLELKDNGCGIPPDALSKIFEPFYTLKANGYGLGLSICYQLISDNRGSISFESEEGTGTVATIKFQTV